MTNIAMPLRRALKRKGAGKPMDSPRRDQAEPGQNTGSTHVAAAGASCAAVARAGATLPPRRYPQIVSNYNDLSDGPAVQMDRQPAHVGLSGASIFARRHHDGPHGAMDYLLYRPANHGRPYRGIVLMLHGCTQSPEDFAVGTRMNAHAEQHGLILIYPAQSWSYGTLNCWNWFRLADQGRSSGEPALLADLVASVAVAHGVAPSRIFAAGLSAGGAMAAILGETHPELFGAVGIHSGLACGSAENFVSAFGAMRGHPDASARALCVPAIIFHGSADETVSPLNVDHLAGVLGQATRRSGGTTGRPFDVLGGQSAAGHPVEVWMIEGAGHAWSGGDGAGSYADPQGPDASAEMIRFFLARASQYHTRRSAPATAT